MKKFFITLMCIVMVVCFMPTVAMAGTSSNCKGGESCTHEAAIGDVHYIEFNTEIYHLTSKRRLLSTQHR